MNEEEQTFYQSIEKIVRDAGELILHAHDGEITVFDKAGETDFVTQYDKKVQSYLIRNLRNLVPEAHFLAEEDGIQQELGDGDCFIIDPIDGTTNFIFDRRHSCISVGLARKGKMLFGAVYNPFTGEMYTAVKGGGAKLNGREIHSSEKGLDENLASFGCARYNSDETDRIFDYAKALYLNSLGIREGGSAALDICGVASGRSGVYVELLLHPWDYAAASLILTEAGGFISSLEGGFITLDQPCSILAAGRKCWKDTTRLLREADEERTKQTDKISAV